MKTINKIVMALLIVTGCGASAIGAELPDWNNKAFGEYLTAEKNFNTRNAMPFSGNVKTRKYHNDGCKFYDCRDCTKFFKTREAVIKAGYKACGKCGG